MRTPKNYTQLVNDKKITNEMIAECIYSVNKRAKNHRDKIRKYKYDRYNRYTVRNIENGDDKAQPSLLKMLKMRWKNTIR